MPRTLDPVSHALRRDGFVDVAQRLIQTKGYEQMSVQDVLDELGVSKGAFYHYFDSKVAILEAVVERMVDDATAALAPVVADPSLPAVRKLEGVFAAIATWKAERKELVLALMRVWLSDENAVVRMKLRQVTAVRLTPPLTSILRQGKAEGVFSATSAEHTAGVLVSLLLGANETASRLFVARQSGAVSFEDVERTLAAYTEAYERVLGLAPGSLTTLDPAALRRWFA